MNLFVASALALFAVASAASAEQISICADNRTEFAAVIRVRALNAGGEMGPEISQFSVDPHSVDCREWDAPLPEFGVTAYLPRTPVGRLALSNGEWVCFQDRADAALNGLVWSLIYDHRSSGYEFGCANTHRNVVLTADPGL